MLFNKFLLLLVVLLFQNICYGTIFSPISFEKQVEEATSGVEVSVSSLTVFKNAFGNIMTEYSFNVLEAYNLTEGDLDNQKLKLTLPGGNLQGVTSMIEGAPSFNQEERSFLLLKKIESKNYLSNFSMGKFKIQKHGNETYYVSEVFPMDPKHGRISKDKMIELMKEKWKSLSVIIPVKIKNSIEKGSQSESFFTLTKGPEKKVNAKNGTSHSELSKVFWIWIVSIICLFLFSLFVIKNYPKKYH